MGKINKGFTIVELLIVVVVIAILAAITLVAFNGVSGQAKESALKTELKGAATQVQTAKVETGSYPNNASGIKKGDAVTLQYGKSATAFCLTATSEGKSFYITENGSIQSGACPAATVGAFVQTITGLNCPTTRTRAVDARDNHTYWVQRLADGQCWMLTNLAYAGGGANTYGDAQVPFVAYAASGNDLGAPLYYSPGSTSFTTEPTNPSTSTNGTGQYGYLYNRVSAPLACPAGWRLPVGGPYQGGSDIGVELGALNTAINSGRTDTSAGLLTGWLGQFAGRWNNGAVTGVGGSGVYWTTQIGIAEPPFWYSASSMNRMAFSPDAGFSARCLAV